MGVVVLSRRAERDLRRLGSGEAVARIRAALEALARGEANLDIKRLAGAPPWHRLRVGDYRILYRPVDPTEANAQGAQWLVARIVNRRDLEGAVTTLT